MRLVEGQLVAHGRIVPTCEALMGGFPGVMVVWWARVQLLLQGRSPQDNDMVLCRPKRMPTTPRMGPDLEAKTKALWTRPSYVADLETDWQEWSRAAALYLHEVRGDELGCITTGSLKHARPCRLRKDNKTAGSSTDSDSTSLDEVEDWEDDMDAEPVAPKPLQQTQPGDVLLEEDGFQKRVAFPTFDLGAIADEPFWLLQVPYTGALQLTNNSNQTSMHPAGNFCLFRPILGALEHQEHGAASMKPLEFKQDLLEWAENHADPTAVAMGMLPAHYHEALVWVSRKKAMGDETIIAAACAHYQLRFLVMDAGPNKVGCLRLGASLVVACCPSLAAIAALLAWPIS
eukprot:4736968-Amphidinium_carterae.1